MDQEGSDDDVIWRLANGDGTALEPLMERWGGHVIDTCFRVFRDPERAADLYAEVWAEIYLRIRLGTESLPRSFGPWAVEVIFDVVRDASEEGSVPVRARLRMRLSTPSATAAELSALAGLRDPVTLRAAREGLPRSFSAAADRMLLAMPEPAAMSRIRPSLSAGTS